MQTDEWTDRETDRQTDMKKLVFAIHNFANATKNDSFHIIFSFSLNIRLSTKMCHRLVFLRTRSD
jgi:hypothetical protein